MIIRQSRSPVATTHVHEDKKLSAWLPILGTCIYMYTCRMVLLVWAVHYYIQCLYRHCLFQLLKSTLHPTWPRRQRWVAWSWGVECCVMSSHSRRRELEYRSSMRRSTSRWTKMHTHVYWHFYPYTCMYSGHGCSCTWYLVSIHVM